MLEKINNVKQCGVGASFIYAASVPDKNYNAASATLFDAEPFPKI
jgi:hypothetical protein